MIDVLLSQVQQTTKYTEPKSTYRWHVAQNMVYGYFSPDALSVFLSF